jgi:23S rRNA pseudouridine1911/1915/1917 synthase
MDLHASVNRHHLIPLILYEDDFIIAVNKPAGMLAQADSTGRECLQGIVTDYLTNHISGTGEPYCVALHRLDRPVSGVMLFAKTTVAAGRLSDDIKHKNIRKFYCALVDSAPINTPAGQWIELNQYLVRKRDRGYILSEDDTGADAVSLKYKIMYTENSSTLLLIELITGKRHQIRVQLSSLGIPIIGDRFYGSPEKLHEEIIALHAHYLCFMHPMTNEPVTIAAPIPPYMAVRLKISPEIADYIQA